MHVDHSHTIRLMCKYIVYQVVINIKVETKLNNTENGRMGLIYIYFKIPVLRKIFVNVPLNKGID